MCKHKDFFSVFMLALQGKLIKLILLSKKSFFSTLIALLFMASSLAKPMVNTQKFTIQLNPKPSVRTHTRLASHASDFNIAYIQAPPYLLRSLLLTGTYLVNLISTTQCKRITCTYLQTIIPPRKNSIKETGYEYPMIDIYRLNLQN